MVALVAVSLVLGGCAVPMRIVMKPEERAKIAELNAHVVVVQDEVAIQVAPSNAGMAAGNAGGLIGALIGSAIDSKVTNNRVKSSQQVMGPFYASIEDIDYRKEFNESMRRELSSYPNKVAKFDTTPRSLNNAQLARLREQLKPGQALLVAAPRYSLTSDFRNLDVLTVVTIWFNDSTSLPVQRGVLHYQSAPVGNGDQSSVDLWRADNAARFRDVMRDSITEVMRLVQLDISVGEAPTAGADAMSVYKYNVYGSDVTVKGQPLKETADRVVFIGEDKKLYSLPKRPLVTADNQGAK
jgi:hypothetical protein